MLSLSWPGPCELIVLLALLGGAAALIVFLTRKSRRREPAAFAVVSNAEADGPGSYRVVGVDQNTRADREITIDAASRANAQVKAELEGMIVTAVTKQK